MISTRNIFLSTGLSFFFKVIAIYNILKYLQNLDKTNNKKIKSVYKIMEDNFSRVDLNYNELKEKYEVLQEKYDELMEEFKKTKEDMDTLNNKWENIYQKNELLTTTVSDNLTAISELVNNNELELVNSETSDSETTDSVIADNNLNDINTINADPKLYHSVSITSSYSNNDIKSYQPRTRSSSLSDVNWLVSTAKFFLG